MKKLSIFALVAATLAACSSENAAPTPEDFAKIESEIQASAQQGVGTTIVAIGPNGDYVIPIVASDTVKEIAAKKKTVAFFSAVIPTESITDGQCMLNIIPQPTMEQMGTPENTCNFRLFCGTAEDIANNEFYAVELCSK